MHIPTVGLVIGVSPGDPPHVTIDQPLIAQTHRSADLVLPSPPVAAKRLPCSVQGMNVEPLGGWGTLRMVHSGEWEMDG